MAAILRESVAGEAESTATGRVSPDCARVCKLISNRKTDSMKRYFLIFDNFFSEKRRVERGSPRVIPGDERVISRVMREKRRMRDAPPRRA
jgi:hypothetical protein